MAPIVIDEKLVYRFHYWDQSLHQGMRHKHELYTLLQSYPVRERLAAYAMAYEKAERGLVVCITVSKDSYRVWLSLRSPEAKIGGNFSPKMIAVNQRISA